MKKFLGSPKGHKPMVKSCAISSFVVAERDVTCVCALAI
jgi:hypothetical protein